MNLQEAEAKIEELKHLVNLWKKNNKEVFAACETENNRLRAVLQGIANTATSALVVLSEFQTRPELRGQDKS